MQSCDDIAVQEFDNAYPFETWEFDGFHPFGDIIYNYQDKIFPK